MPDRLFFVPIVIGRQLLSKQLCLRDGLMLCYDSRRFDLCWTSIILCVSSKRRWRLLPSRLVTTLTIMPGITCTAGLPLFPSLD